MTAPGPASVPLAEALAVLAAVLDRPLADARDDTPLAALGADPVALLLWADRVEASAPGAVVDADGLAAATTAGDLARLLSATMAPGSSSGGGTGR